MSVVRTLNVGGQKFATMQNVLVEHSDFFAALVSPHWKHPTDQKGRIFLDRDPDLFREVMKVIRGTCTYPLTPNVIAELDFYGVTPRAPPGLYLDHNSEVTRSPFMAPPVRVLTHGLSDQVTMVKNTIVVVTKDSLELHPLYADVSYTFPTKQKERADGYVMEHDNHVYCFQAHLLHMIDLKSFSLVVKPWHPICVQAHLTSHTTTGRLAVAIGAEIFLAQVTDLSELSVFKTTSLVRRAFHAGGDHCVMVDADNFYVVAETVISLPFPAPLTMWNGITVGDSTYCFGVGPDEQGRIYMQLWRLHGTTHVWTHLKTYPVQSDHIFSLYYHKNIIHIITTSGMYSFYNIKSTKWNHVPTLHPNSRIIGCCDM